MTMKTFLTGLAALIICGLASCSKDEGDVNASGTVTIGVMPVAVRSAGIFRDRGNGGIGFVFCSEETPLDMPLSEVPSGTVLCLDVPEAMMDGLVRDLPGETDGGSWAFCYCAYSENAGMQMDGLGEFHRLEDVRLGTFRGSFGVDGSVHLEFYAYSGDRFAVGCTYDGIPDESNEYIWAWDQ